MENKKGKLGSRLAGSEAFLSVAASLVCIVIGLLLGLIVLAIINAEHAFGDGLMVILQSGFKSPRNMGTVLANAAPLIMTGLSVGFAFKTGLFNIGAAGAVHARRVRCALLRHRAAMAVVSVPAGGDGIRRGLGRAAGHFQGVSEHQRGHHGHHVQRIGLYMVNDIMYGKGKSPMYDLASTKTYSLRKAAPQAMIPSCGMSDAFGKLQSVTIAIFIAIFFAIVVYIILNKTAFGYELRACGFNKNAARYAGINEKRNIILSMMISGALAGVGAGLYYLSTVAEWNPQVSTALPAMGFNGISTALLACSNPIGTIFSSLFISYITVGGTKLSTQYYSKEIADVITALIIYLCAFSLLFKNKIRALLEGKAKRVSVGKGGDD